MNFFVYLKSLEGKLAFASVVENPIVHLYENYALGVVRKAYLINKKTKDCKLIIEVGNYKLKFDPMEPTICNNGNCIAFDDHFGTDIGFDDFSVREIFFKEKP